MNQLSEKFCSQVARLAGMAAIAALFVTAALADTPTMSPLTAPKTAGYLLADGSLQVVGNSDIGGIVDKLNALFVQQHPGFKFKFIRANNLAAAQSLVYDTTAFAPMSTDSFGTATTPYAFIVKADTFGIRIAHASVNPEAKVSPMAIIVHPSNPVESLSTSQIARIFASGGRKWDISHWGQVGAGGAWTFREIRPCGLPESNHYPAEDSEFADFMFSKKIGGDQPALGYVRVTNYADVVSLVSSDPAAIGITALNRVTPAVKVLGLTSGGWSKPSKGSAEDIVAGNYPYDRSLFIFVRRSAGQPIEPFLDAYLRMVLSPAGQAAIATEASGFLPLNPTEIALEVGKLN